MAESKENPTSMHGISGKPSPRKTVSPVLSNLYSLIDYYKISTYGSSSTLPAALLTSPTPPRNSRELLVSQNKVIHSDGRSSTVAASHFWHSLRIIITTTINIPVGMNLLQTHLRKQNLIAENRQSHQTTIHITS